MEVIVNIWKKSCGMLSLLLLCFSAYANEVENTKFSCNPSLVTILTIDGGGVMGIIPAVFLDKFEEQTHERGVKLFDFMSGVSTGTILVSLLATPGTDGQPKYPASQLVKIYEKNGKLIFSNSLLNRILSLNGLIGPRYLSTGMEHVANNLFGDTVLSKMLSRVILFGYDTQNKGLIAFSNWENTGPNMPYYKIKDILAGTTAIMSFFQAKKLYDQQDNVRHIIVDASLVLNNPTAIAFLFAQNQCPNAQHYLVISLGTGHDPKVNIEPTGWGLIRWLPDLITTTISGETVTANVTMAKLAALLNAGNGTSSLPRVLFVRLNPQVPAEQTDPVNVDESHLTTLKKIAEQYSLKKQSLFQCISHLLVTRDLTKESRQCLNLLENEHPSESSIYLQLEGWVKGSKAIH